MTIGCNIWMICLKLNWFLYGLSRMLQFSEFVWALSYSVWDVLSYFLLLDATDRSKISSDQKRFFIAISLYPLSFFANTPFKSWNLVLRLNLTKYLIYPKTANIKKTEIDLINQRFISVCIDLKITCYLVSYFDLFFG